MLHVTEYNISLKFGLQEKARTFNYCTLETAWASA